MDNRSIYDEKPEFDHEESVTVGWLVRGGYLEVVAHGDGGLD